MKFKWINTEEEFFEILEKKNVLRMMVKQSN